MTATDELRRMLDERGVKHYDGVECTYWGDTVLARRDGSCPIYRFSATEVADGVSVHLLRVSPEQAIEATLGRGTCRFKTINQFVDARRSRADICECDRCGYRCARGFIHDERFKYCPNCGRKVVDE